MTQQPTADRYRQLRERVLNRTASPLELREFESIVSKSSEYRRDYLTHLHQEAILLQSMSASAEVALPEPSRPSPIETKSRSKLKRLYLMSTALAACLALLAASFAFIDLISLRVRFVLLTLEIANGPFQRSLFLKTNP